MVTRTDYIQEAVEAARSVLVELVHLLGEYRDSIVVVGGWVPPFLCPHPESPHIGSMDVDLALDHRKLNEQGYRTILQLLLDRGYQQGKQPFIFHRSVALGDHSVKVEVDFLGCEYEGTGRTHRTQQVQDIRVRKARGADLAFDDPVSVSVSARLPDGTIDSVSLNIASVVSFLMMKAMALADRLKEKDSWDIYYVLRNYPGGVEKVAKEFRPRLMHGLIMEGLAKLRRHFSSIDSVGPAQVAGFQEENDLEEQKRLRRDAYERVTYLLERLEVE